MRYLEKERRKKIGYDYVLDKLQILSPYGRKKLHEIKPFLINEEEKLKKEHDRIEVLRELMKDKKTLSKIEIIFMKIRDIVHTCNLAHKGKVLDEVELYEIKLQSTLSNELKDILKTLNIDSTLILNDLHEIIEILDPNKDGLPTYHIYNSYSLELAEIRALKKDVEKEIMSASKEEREILLQKRLEIVIRENQEELVVRKQLSKKLEVLIEKLIANIDIIGRLDFIIAKAKICNYYNLKRPNISNDRTLIGKGLINLEIKDLVESLKEEYTPLDIELKNGTTIVTGANMGGKTVALKTLTLNIFLFQMGFYPLAEKATMPLFDFIYFISDDMQDISKGLSTFGAEMIKLKEIMIFLHRGTGFIALDEFARGTNPYEGQKIAKSLGEYLNKHNSISIMATHYDGVISDGMEHYQVVGLRDVDFNKLKKKVDLNKRDSIKILQEYMDYRLEKCEDYEVPRDALNIAILLGLDEDLTNHILENYKEEN